MIPDRVMRKIKRCLALSNSANDNEAGIALRQAQALMAQYGVNQEDLALADFDMANASTAAGKKPPRYLEQLAQLINRVFGTSTVYSTRRDGIRICGRYEFVGPKDAVQVAAYAYVVLQRQLIRDRRAFQKTLNKRLKRETKTRRGDAFAEAWVAGAYTVVTPLALTDEVRELHRKYREFRYGELESLQTREHKALKQHDQHAVFVGYHAGSKARLSAGVAATRREELSHG
ncbi:DUF2786 domain-containing protein [Vreelandella olivaria]|uniref:DUF2786 domain-containing protein n=1 Tax=Vreelandella olivaria TaxID=390919 RepID=UPI00201ECFFB|nr:DUF2786 domain-containing protein [Halomonas olivaria]